MPLERKDKGASLIMVAFAMTLLIGAVALVVDLGMLRADIRSDRLAADASSTAGVAQINPFKSPDYVDACETAWDYALLNLEYEGSVDTPHDCSAKFSGSCSPGVIRQTSGTAGPYTITISQPVPDGHDLMGSQAPDPDIDGSPCQRLAVTIQKSRPHTFARVLGFDSDTTTVNSVARVTTRPGEGEIVPLLLLEPLDCEAMYTSGQGKITVTYNDTTNTPGIIVVDSNASTCGPSNPYSIDSKGNQNGWIRAVPVPSEDIPSAILSYALANIGAADPSASYDPNDLDDDPEVLDNDRLFPIPTPAFDRITRKPIDWRYNCKSGYADYPLDASNPTGPGIPIPDCPFSTQAYIDLHTSTYDGGSPLPGTFKSWMGEGYSCSPNNETISVSGNWHIDCPPSGPNDIGLTVSGGSITIDGNVVMNGGLDLLNDARMTVNPLKVNMSDVFVYVRDGIILKRAQSTLILNQTFVYLNDGAVDIRAGSSTPPATCEEDQTLVTGICWSAPQDGDFEDLALWSEANLAHQIGGQGGNNLTGTFFTPGAEPFSLDGQGSQLQFRAQFITRRLEVKGQAVVEMTPDPERTTPIPVRAVDLIR